MNTDTNSIDQSPLMGGDEHSDAANDDHDGHNNESTLITAHNTYDHATTGAFGSTKLYLSELARIFSVEFLSFVAIYGFFVSGGSYILVTVISLPLFKQMGISASRQQLYTCMLLSPRAMKPFVGVVSTLFPIMGYNMRYIALFAILIGFSASLVLLRTYPLVDTTMKQGPNDTPSAETIADTVVMPCFVAISSLSATFDILVQGKYAEIMRNHPGVGTSITTFKLFFSRLGKVLVQSYVGPLSDKGEYKIFFWISLAYSITPLLPTLAGWIPEQKRTKENPGMMALCGQLILFDNGAFQEKKKAFILITLCGLCPVLFVSIICLAGPDIGLVSATVLIVMFCTANFFMFPRKFCWVFVSIIIIQLSLVQITSVLGYYYTASERCVPDGPHFNYNYYITFAGTVGSTISLFSVVLYQKLFAKWRFRSAMSVAIITSAVVAMADIIVINRWNIIIGIPDKVFFMFGNGIFAQFITTIKAIPLDAICSKMSPPGMGSTITAYILGMFEFCGLVSNLLGSKAIDWSGMKTVGEDCNFTSLSYLVLITQIVIPITIGIPAIFLIPNVFQTENLIDWEKEGWYSERTDMSVVSGLLANVTCDDVNINDVSGKEDIVITEQRIV